ncbi:MAG: hypothetical protein IT435_13690 [Phycisphaerales bacterium]|nr:hypothetical protein [Phycisphaerales bacterium]
MITRSHRLIAVAAISALSALAPQALAGYTVSTTEAGNDDNGDYYMTWKVTIGKDDVLGSFHLNIVTDGFTVSEDTAKAGDDKFKYKGTKGDKSAYSGVWQRSKDDGNAKGPGDFTFKLCFKPDNGKTMAAPHVLKDTLAYDIVNADGTSTVVNFTTDESTNAQRPAAIPAPATVLLFSAPFAGFAWTRHRRG